MSMRTVAVSLALLVAGVTPAVEPKAFPGTPTQWNGFARHDFKVGELDATVVVPD